MNDLVVAVVIVIVVVVVVVVHPLVANMCMTKIFGKLSLIKTFKLKRTHKDDSGKTFFHVKKSFSSRST